MPRPLGVQEPCPDCSSLSNATIRAAASGCCAISSFSGDKTAASRATAGLRATPPTTPPGGGGARGGGGGFRVWGGKTPPLGGHRRGGGRPPPRGPGG